MFGDFTVIKKRGKSAVDYTIVSKEFLKNILHLQIGDPSLLFDHNYIETTIKCKIVEKIERQEVSATKRLMIDLYGKQNHQYYTGKH